MESGINKLKVVWICHFTNDDIQEKLKVRKKVAEKAPWITLGIEEAKKRDDIELHVVSPHRWISKNREFAEGNIYYHFFNPGIPIYGRHWPRFFRFDIFTNFYFNKKKIKNYVNNIKPDIIHLHGLENAYYSSTILQFINKYSILATIQGFISLQLPESLSKDIKKRIDIEKEILSSVKNFGVRTEAMKEEILKYNKNANLYWHEYFSNIPKDTKIESKDITAYDLIFFARVSKAKGVEDLIKATGLLKKQYPNIKTAIIGGANNSYLKELNELALLQNCVENIDFFGFLPKQEDVYKILAKSKICVLPTYNDTIPGTIIESMFAKIPVISYKTGGIPDINQKEEIILLSEQGDIDGLVTNILKLLLNDKYSKELAEKAYKYAINRWSNEKAMDDIITAYKTILSKV